MCNVDPDEVTEMIRDIQIDRSNSICRKCGSSNVDVVLRLKEPYCKDCFLVYFVHKFRSTIGKSRQIKAGDNVIVGVSGGMSSSSMIHLIQQGISDDSVKKLRFHPSFLYIDESFLYDKDEAVNMKEICSHILNCGFKCYVIGIESIMETGELHVNLYTENEEIVESPDKTANQQKLKDLIDNCKSISSKQDILYRLKLQLLCSVAQKLGYQKLFLGDNATTIAVRILSNIALGRGSHISSDVHFKTIHHDIEVYRPLREALEDEIGHYARIYDIKYQNTTFNIQGNGINSCTRKFVFDLQKDFPATIPTIFRTGDKLCGNNADDTVDDESNKLCLLCGNALDTSKTESSALYATFISQKLSNSSKGVVIETAHTNTTQNDVGCMSTSDESCNGSCNCKSTNEFTFTNEDVETCLCYSCRITFRDMDSKNKLPPNLLMEIKQQINLSKMKEEIQDFLL